MKGQCWADLIFQASAARRGPIDCNGRSKTFVKGLLYKAPGGAAFEIKWQPSCQLSHSAFGSPAAWFSRTCRKTQQGENVFANLPLPPGTRKHLRTNLPRGRDHTQKVQQRENMFACNLSVFYSRLQTSGLSLRLFRHLEIAWGKG
eukprot:6198386-Pleurochrysis_carterae.AAC.2